MILLTYPARAAGNEAAVGAPEMRFALVRSSAVGCEPTCPQWISAEGNIIWTTPNKFRMFLERLGKHKFPVIISSNGGDVRGAMILGRMIRQAKLDVAVGQTRFEGCSPHATDCKLDKAKKGVYSGVVYSSPTFCLSACSMALAGGVRRLAGSFALVGVHQMTRSLHKREVTYKTEYAIVNGKKKAVGKTVAASKELGEYQSNVIPGSVKKAITDYFREMGVQEQLLDVMLSVPFTDMRKLELVEMVDLKLLTSLDSGELISSSYICSQEAPAPNCVRSGAGATKSN